MECTKLVVWEIQKQPYRPGKERSILCFKATVFFLWPWNQKMGAKRHRARGLGRQNSGPTAVTYINEVPQTLLNTSRCCVPSVPLPRSIFFSPLLYIVIARSGKAVNRTVCVCARAEKCKWGRWGSRCRVPPEARFEQRVKSGRDKTAANQLGGRPLSNHGPE